nr:MAG TPA: hypothetical protein [Caudoviricetes sp.]
MTNPATYGTIETVKSIEPLQLNIGHISPAYVDRVGTPVREKHP